MKYAVVKTGGKQYRVKEGEELEVEKIKGKKGDKIELGEVLLLVDNDKVKIGTPKLDKIRVTAEILEQKKDKKIRVAKFKAKSRYRRVKGHRQLLTRVKVLKITG